MPWTRLDPTEIIPHLHFVHGPADQDDAAHAERDMERLRRALLTGEFIAVQDEFAETRSVCRWGACSSAPKPRRPNTWGARPKGHDAFRVDANYDPDRP